MTDDIPLRGELPQGDIYFDGHDLFVHGERLEPGRYALAGGGFIDIVAGDDDGDD